LAIAGEISVGTIIAASPSDALMQIVPEGGELVGLRVKPFVSQCDTARDQFGRRFDGLAGGP